MHYINFENVDFFFGSCFGLLVGVKVNAQFLNWVKIIYLWHNKLYYLIKLKNMVDLANKVQRMIYFLGQLIYVFEFN